MSGIQNLKDLNLPEDAVVVVSYSDGKDVWHCTDSYVEDTVIETGVADRLAEVLTTSSLALTSQWGNTSYLEEMRDDGLLDDYPRDYSGFTEHVAKVIRENFYNYEWIESSTENYDYKRGYTTLKIELKTTAWELLTASPADLSCLIGWTAELSAAGGTLQLQL